ncbi:MAG: tRNA (N(6)-L-threonylcarbamoyladenosine(37)-C(2))-methylthiotransferase MtaB [Ruminococcaceae bacterium]|nr:tRNA (N(6)-L-threonylcarbamoyladenosine(37)-C(2))-methylthiotransferase MtaB [Oscillospiraceae bacterium]
MWEQTPTVGILTLGCKVNQYESEAIAEAFEASGFSVLPASSSCDCYVINTCTVTAESDRKARQAIRRAIHQNPNAYILVTGCLAQADPDSPAKISGVDYVCGNANKLSVVEAALQLFREGKKQSPPTVIRTPADSNGFEAMEIRKFDRTRAYIKIEDGCESKCTYCIIPKARGSIRSKAPEDVLREVCTLTAGGCREVVLTGIETASYGKDLKNCSLAELLCLINKIPSIGRVRLGSLDPSLIKQSFVDRIASLPAVAPHFHLSMQSGSDRVLARMKRKYNTRMALEGMERLRRAMLGVQFTTDMIAGFPQETEEEFEETLRFIEQAKFLMIHAFPYSRRKGTVADTMTGQIPEEIKRERVHRITELQKRIRRKILEEQIGATVEVLFETCKNKTAHGHTPSFIDVTCSTELPLQGELRKVRITGVDEHGCVGELTEETI